MDKTRFDSVKNKQSTSKKLLTITIFSLLCLCICICTFLCGCDKTDRGSSAAGPAGGSSDSQPQSIDVFAMNTSMTLTAYGTNADLALKNASDEIYRLDNMLSISSTSGEVANLNRDKKAVFSDEAIYLLKRSLEIAESTDGLFNPAVLPVMEAWGFTSGDYRVPGDEELSELLNHLSYEGIEISENSEVSLPEDISIDFGAIAKGYAADRVIDIMRESGVDRALISLGGTIRTLGKKDDGSNWIIGIKDPFEPSGLAGTVESSSSDEALITSGAYERYFMDNGIRYHHIIDPRTAKPSESDLESVTIISQDGTLADALSTALYVMGSDAAADYWRQHSSEFDVVMITADKQMLVSSGVADRVTPADGFTVKVIE